MDLGKRDPTRVVHLDNPVYHTKSNCSNLSQFKGFTNMVKCVTHILAHESKEM